LAISLTLVGGDRLEDVVAAAVVFADLLHAGDGRDFIPGHDQRAPLEILPSVHHQREVQFDLWIKQRRTDGGRAVDDREHRRRHDVGVPRRSRGIHVEMDRVALAHGECVLLDLLATDRIAGGRVSLAYGFGVDWHRDGLLARWTLPRTTTLTPLHPPSSRSQAPSAGAGK
jgi:hypothetical protein